MPKDTRIRGALAKRWCFTLNNYTEDECKRITERLTCENPVFAKVGKEVGDNGTPHLQGFVHLARKVRLTGLKSLLGDRIHAEVSRGTDQQNDKYCSKGGSILVELGQAAVGTTDSGGGFAAYQHVIALSDRLAEGQSVSKISEDEAAFPYYIRHSRIIKELAADKIKNQNLAVAGDEMGDPILKAWQRDLLAGLLPEPDVRKITWIVDATGNSGKTYISKYLCVKGGVVRFENGKSADIKHAYQGERVVLFDLSRAQEAHFNYEVLESVKNGIMFSGKYESGMKVYPSPHVIVFANWPPDESKLSADRWEVKYLTPEDCEWVNVRASDVGKVKVECVHDDPDPVQYKEVADVIVIDESESESESVSELVSSEPEVWDEWDERNWDMTESQARENMEFFLNI